MKSDQHWQQLVFVLGELDKLKKAIELIANGVDPKLTDPGACPQIKNGQENAHENNLDLVVKQSEEFKEQSLELLRRELEPTFREKYAEAVRDLNVALSVAVEKNHVVRDIFNAAERLFGQNQNVIHLLTWKELLIDQQAQSKLLAWRNYVEQEGYILLDEKKRV